MSMMQIEASLSIPIIVDTGRTNFRVGYGGDKNPKSINPTVYWKDSDNNDMFTPIPTS